MKTKFAILIIAIFTSLQAFATGDTSCNAVTANSKVEIYLLNSRMPGAPVLNGNGYFETKMKNAPLVVNFNANDHELPGFWSVGNDLKMFFYKEDHQSQDFKSYILKVEMSYSEEAMEMVGEFQILFNENLIDSGPIFCEFG